MFFLARSVACIALVASALPNGFPATHAAAAGRTVARSGEAVIDRFCRESPARCMATLNRMTVAARDAHATADRLPHWTGPALATVD